MAADEGVIVNYLPANVPFDKISGKETETLITTFGKRGRFVPVELEAQIATKLEECFNSSAPIDWSPISIIKDEGTPLDIKSILYNSTESLGYDAFINTIIKSFSSTVERSYYRFSAIHTVFPQGSGAGFIHVKNFPSYPGDMTNDFKIHICVKPEYVLWAVAKIIKFGDENIRAEKNGYASYFKFLFEGRSIDPSERDLAYLSEKGNGGAAPAIVVYGTPNVGLNRTILKNLITLFEPYVESIGNIRGKMQLPAGNLRYNKLIAYASGDRSTKLILLRNLAEGKIDRFPERYGASDWVENLCRRGQTDVIEKYFLDTDFCTPRKGINALGREYIIPAKKDWWEVKRYSLPDPRTLFSEPMPFYRTFIPRGLRNYVRSSYPNFAESYFGLRNTRRVNKNIVNYRNLHAREEEAANSLIRAEDRKQEEAEYRAELEAAAAAEAAAEAAKAAQLAVINVSGLRAKGRRGPGARGGVPTAPAIGAAPTIPIAAAAGNKPKNAPLTRANGPPSARRATRRSRRRR
jgi:hypothetical protein